MDDDPDSVSDYNTDSAVRVTAPTVPSEAIAAVTELVETDMTAVSDKADADLTAVTESDDGSDADADMPTFDLGF